MMKVPAFVRLLPLLLLTLLLSSCALPQPELKQFDAVVRTHDELYEYLHGGGRPLQSFWAWTDYYLGTKDGYHIMRTVYGPGLLPGVPPMPPDNIAIRQELLPQWHVRPYPLPRTRWLPIPWILFCPYYPVPPRVQQRRDAQEREWWRTFQAELKNLPPPRPAPPHAASASSAKTQDALSIDNLLSSPKRGTKEYNDCIRSQLRQPNAEDYRERDALIRAQ